ncbi:MAG: hypothetical protein JWO78_1053 [Micavibrio sp.]|nr:hypothetical protein [Micavibrio sp.]
MSEEQNNNPQMKIWNDSYELMLKMDDLFEGYTMQSVLMALIRVAAKLTANTSDPEKALGDVTGMLQGLHAEEINQIKTASKQV